MAGKHSDVLVTWSLHVAIGCLAGKIVTWFLITWSIVTWSMLFGGNKLCPLYSKGSWEKFQDGDHCGRVFGALFVLIPVCCQVHCREKI